MKKLFYSLITLFLSLSCFAFNYSSENECLNNNYINEWGRLKLVGNQLSSESGSPVQLRGWSTHGHQWSGYACYDQKSDFEGMKKFGANIARIAMYIREGGGVNESWMKNCIDWTAELGMYCIVDWHMLDPGTPTSYLGDGAVSFFNNISNYVTQKGYKHVIYEICNEPNDNTEGDIYRPTLWKDIKDYAKDVLPAIAQNDPSAIVIVGTPQWDQALVHPIEDPIPDDFGLSLMYAFHYYACSHEQYLGGLQAAAASIPVFVSEWGVTENKGQSGCCTESSDKLMDVCSGLNLGSVKISWCNWSWSTEGGESRSLNSANNYTESNFSTSGRYILQQLRSGDKNPSSSAKSTPYQSQSQTIYSDKESLIMVDKYDNGGEGVGYHEYDADWLFDISNGNCNAGVGTSSMASDYRPNECVDISYTDKDVKEYCNIGYIVAGEWVKYTVNVEKAGYYRVSPYANSHISNNIIAITNNGKNAIRDLKDKENASMNAVRVKINGTGVSDGGYDNWDFTSLYSEYDGKDAADYGVYFENAGEQTLALAFFTECAGLGPLKFTPETNLSGEENIEQDNFEIYPNPSENGIFNVLCNDLTELAIIDIYGQEVYRTVIQNNAKINAGLASGVYFVKLKTNKSVLTKKLIVK